MDETSKTRKIWGPFERSILTGRGIDIGSGPDPLGADVRTFDIADGDANDISRFVHERFDFVYASHCLEHMRDPRTAILEWWKLVKPGGHLFFIVPDEDLYEQGVFPSRFNSDHKATFTIAKRRSWSPVSINVLDLARSLPDGQLIEVVLHDHGYDRRLLRHGPVPPPNPMLRFAFRVHHAFNRRGWLPASIVSIVERYRSRHVPVDQTLRPDVLAQIQCVVRRAI